MTPDTLQYARCTSTLTLDGVSFLTLSANVLQTISADPNKRAAVSGSISLAGKTGNLALTLVAAPLGINFTSETIEGVLCQHAQIGTGAFSYLDLKTQKRTQAMMLLDLTTGAANQAGFLIFDVLTKALICQTEDPAHPGVYSLLPLHSGATSLRF